MSIADNLRAVHERIDAAARAAGRNPDDVTLVVVSKEVAVAAIAAALDAGAHDLGENRAQELIPKAESLAERAQPPRWHFIGRLQRNKVRALAPHVALWQSVDRVELLEELARRAPGASVLVQVSLAGEEQKGGCAPGDVEMLTSTASALGLHAAGLMTVPPLDRDPRPYFARLRAQADRLGLAVCSMGMSGDYEAAIAEGATMVRVGSAVFGPRPGAAGARR